MADYYKNIIAGQFPQSMYAKVLTNPGYLQELEQEDERIRQYYSETYDLYKTGKYPEVTERAKYAQENFKDNPLIPRFGYLSLIASGKTGDRKIFRENLQDWIARYPGTDMADDAQNLIDYMDKEHPEIKEAQDIMISQKLYQLNPDSEHVFSYLVDKKTNINQLIFNIINFNLDHFDKLNLIAEVADLNPRQNLVVVKPFPDEDAVMKYLNAIRSSENILKDIPGSSLIPFVISAENYNILKTNKSADLYLKFFNENYR